VPATPLWKCSLIVAGAATTVGVRQSIYNIAFENVAFYDPVLGRNSIRYDEQECLLADLSFESKTQVYALETSLIKFLEGFTHQRHSTLRLLLKSFEFVEGVRASDVVLERVQVAHYDPSENNISPQTSIAQFYAHSATSVADINTPLFIYQRIEKENVFSDKVIRPDKCHLLDKAACVGDLTPYKSNENNIILLSKDFHSLFDGINGEIPGILLAFLSRTEDRNITTGRYEIELYVEFYDTKTSEAYAWRLKPGSQKYSDLVWSTKLWVVDVHDFKYCLDWKTEKTSDLWNAIDRIPNDLSLS
jgi:hypothetical protein